MDKSIVNIGKNSILIDDVASNLESTQKLKYVMENIILGMLTGTV